MPHSISIEQFCAFNETTRSAKYIFNNVLHNCWTQGLVCWCYLLATNVAFYRYFIHSSILGKVTIQKKHFLNNKKNSILESKCFYFRQRHTNIGFILTSTVKESSKKKVSFWLSRSISMHLQILPTFRCIRDLCAKWWYRHCPS